MQNKKSACFCVPVQVVDIVAITQELGVLIHPISCVFLQEHRFFKGDPCSCEVGHFHVSPPS